MRLCSKTKEQTEPGNAWRLAPETHQFPAKYQCPCSCSSNTYFTLASVFLAILSVSECLRSMSSGFSARRHLSLLCTLMSSGLPSDQIRGYIQDIGDSGSAPS
ncbi:hypothetical protein T09_10187 [Trichinella sp. T9]|nr:hypothetical protein T09_10187 [Trichinella sp. T9]